jgi:TPR repeat protein
VLIATVAAAPVDGDVADALAAGRARGTAGDVVAQLSLGEMLYYGGENTAEAVDWLRKAATQRCAPAEFQLGQIFDFGFGVAQSDREALDWYRRAADHGSAAAQRSVGDFYRKGRGVASEAAEAARWFRRAPE